MYLFNYPDLTDAARQLGEQTYAYRLLYKEIDNKFKSGAINSSQWIDEHVKLDAMRKELDKEYKCVHSAMNCIVFTTEHPEGERDKRLIRVFLEAAYPDENPEDFCIMQ